MHRILPLALLLAACVEDTAAVELETEAPSGGLPEECDAADYRHLVGSNVAAVTLPSDSGIRVYSDADLITQEYLPQRTNIVYNADGIIYRVWCG